MIIRLKKYEYNGRVYQTELSSDCIILYYIHHQNVGELEGLWSHHMHTTFMNNAYFPEQHHLDFFWKEPLISCL